MSARQDAIALVIGGRIAPADVPRFCARLGVLLEGHAAADVVYDVGGILDPDAVTIDALARLQLTARRLERHIWLRHASSALQELLALIGLSEVVPHEKGRCVMRSPCRCEDCYAAALTTPTRWPSEPLNIPSST